MIIIYESRPLHPLEAVEEGALEEMRLRLVDDQKRVIIANQAGATLGGPGKAWENHGKSWENPHKTMGNHGKLSENPGKSGFPGEKNGKILGKPWEKLWDLHEHGNFTGFFQCFLCFFFFHTKMRCGVRYGDYGDYEF